MLSKNSVDEPLSKQMVASLNTVAHLTAISQHTKKNPQLPCFQSLFL